MARDERLSQPHLALVAAHPGAMGGMERFCRFLAGALIDRGWRITVALSGCDIYRGMADDDGGALTIARVDWLDETLAGDRDYRWPVIDLRRRWFAKVRPDAALFVQSSNTPMRASVAGAFLARVPIVTTHRTMAWPVEKSPSGRYCFGLVRGLGLHRRRVVRKTWLTAALARRVVFNSDSVRQGYVEAYRYPFRKTCVIPNAVELPELSETTVRNDAVTIGYVGRVAREKRLDILFEAIARLRTQRPVRLVIHGQGAKRTELEALSHKLGLADRIEWRGPTDAIQDAYRRCDIVALCSPREASSNMTLEAMAAGKAVIVPRTGGMEELVRGGTCGICVPPLDVQALEGAIARLVDNDRLRNDMGARARKQAAACHDPATIGNRWADVLRQAAVRGWKRPFAAVRRVVGDPMSVESNAPMADGRVVPELS